MKLKKLNAFTLIELLVVIAIVGILSGFVFVSLNSATNQANDTRRRSDLSQIVKALIIYNTFSQTYPIETCSIGLDCSETVNNALGQASTITGPNNTYYTYSSDDGISLTVSTIMSNTNTYSYNPETGYSESETEMGLPGYAKRKSLTISNNSGEVLTDYQIMIDLTYDSDMQSDFDDIKFTNSSGIILSYYLESKIDSTSAQFWIKIPEIPINDSIIYIYYGNETASSDSNGENTFLLYEDFSDRKSVV